MGGPWGTVWGTVQVAVGRRSLGEGRETRVTLTMNAVELRAQKWQMVPEDNSLSL